MPALIPSPLRRSALLISARPRYFGTARRANLFIMPLSGNAGVRQRPVPGLKSMKRLFRRTTGLVVDAYFSGTKIQWLLDHVPGLRQKAAGGQVAFGTIDSWLIYKLTDGASHVTDMTNASRTLIFDIKAKTWSKPLLKLLNIPENILPQGPAFFVGIWVYGSRCRRFARQAFPSAL